MTIGLAFGKVHWVTEQKHPADDESEDLELFKSPEEIRELGVKLSRIDDQVLTTRQISLVEDSAGLLIAISNGHPVRDRSQIRQNLVAAISDFGDGKAKVAELSEPQRKAMSLLRMTLRVVTANGIAVDPAVDRIRRSHGRNQD